MDLFIMSYNEVLILANQSFKILFVPGSHPSRNVVRVGRI
jgi:hypothetical protein